MKKKVVLIIMDGWGEAPATHANAVSEAHTPFIDNCYKKYSHAQLLTDGENVGLPAGQMGNSEVGHMNLGAGRIVYQDLVKLNKEVRDNLLKENVEWKKTVAYCNENNKPLHLIGLVSNGGVHSHIEHLKHLCFLAHEAGIAKVFIHAFTDGRDTDPKSGLAFIADLENYILQNNLNTKIATVCGRYYAMDRDKRWERVAIAYNAMVNGEGKKFSSATDAMQSSYTDTVTDEFILPCIITEAGNAIAKIAEGDAVLCFNFRTDRCREITVALTQTDMHEQNMHTMNLHYVTMTRYDESFNGINVMYEKDNLNKTLGEVLSENGLHQLRMAETEKYPHVTFFFNGGREAAFEKEDRIMEPSPKVATYDLQPEMSAVPLKNAFLKAIENKDYDFVCLNFANPDMVGHTGVYDAVKKAVETVDACVAEMVSKAGERGYSFIIIADHGNSEYMINDDGSPNTAHTTNPVPFIVIDRDVQAVKNGILADVAPTILNLLSIAQPNEMTGNSLVVL